MRVQWPMAITMLQQLQRVQGEFKNIKDYFQINRGWSGVCDGRGGGSVFATGEGVEWGAVEDCGREEREGRKKYY